MSYHYVYRITNVLNNNHYYGSRTSATEPKNDIGIKYFSSSRDTEFMKDQQRNQQDYKYKVVRMFDNRKDALAFEIKLHNKFNVGVNESFYNKVKQTSIGWDTTGVKRSAESKLKQSRTTKGSKRSDEWARKISEALKGKTHGESFREKCRQNNLGEKNPNYGKEHTDEHKMKIAETLKSNPKVQCPYCGKHGSVSPMQRWHFDNCKDKN